MRQNLILLLTLSALILGAYLFEEIGDRNKRATEDKRTTLFNMKKYGEVKSFTSPEASLKLLAGGASVTVKNNWPVDPKRLQEFFSILTGIRAKRILTESEVNSIDRKTMFPTEEAVLTFHFEKGVVSFRLGKKLDTEQSFYLEVIQGDDKKVAIAHDVGEVSAMYNKKDSYKDDTKYRRFLTLFYMKDTWFHDNSIFNAEEKHHLQKISELELDSNRNRRFKLIFNGGNTLPAPIPGIGINIESFDKFMTKLLKTKATEVIFNGNKEALLEKKSMIKIFYEDDSTLDLDLYGKYQDKSGYFVLKNNQIFKLSKTESSLFFENVQKFWNKIPTNDILNASLKASISFPRGKSIDFELNGKKNFEAKTITPGLELDNKEMYKLIEFLGEEADFITQGTVDEEKGISQLLLKLNLGGEKISLVRKKSELIVSKVNKRLKYHYKNRHHLPFSFEMSKLLVGSKGTLE
ncbi:MAG: hypothetical protein KC493_12005 [Bacteriovoracaceae bacterium]|nr:hypothetical protein [Bacteriovoracaceae bacterium]